MQELDEPSLSALKCSGCNGLWFRSGSHETAKDAPGIEAIDADPGESSARYNTLRDIDCPECHKKLIKMVDRAQYHIQFEACTYCHGVFFDAGEFSDYTEYSFMVRVRQTISTLRNNLGS
jgi:hypothetical protein